MSFGYQILGFGKGGGVAAEFGVGSRGVFGGGYNNSGAIINIIKY